MKRKAPIWFVMTACIAILVHAALPHHHHIKAFVSICNVLDAKAHGKMHDMHDGLLLCFHSHHSDSGNDSADDEECPLSESVLAACRIDKHQSDNLIPDVGGNDLHLDVCTSLTQGQVAQQNDSTPLRYPPLVRNGHQSSIKSSGQLRAPPV